MENGIHLFEAKKRVGQWSNDAKYPIVCADIALKQLDPTTLSVFVEQERVTEYIEEQTYCLVESGVKYWSCRFCEKYS